VVALYSYLGFSLAGKTCCAFDCNTPNWRFAM